MISKDILKKIRALEIHTKKLLRGAIQGNASSREKGYGLEFDQIREYQLGDDVRFIDWKSSARMNKLLVKQYIEECSRTIMLLVDTSASSFYGSASSKFDTIAQIAGTLALVSNMYNDQVGLILFSDNIECYMPPKSGKKHIHEVMRQLFSYKPQRNKTSIKQALHYLGTLKRTDTVAFVISDFIDTDFEKELKVITQRYEVIAIHCVDRLEQEFPSVGFIEVEDIETGAVLLMDARNIQKINHFFSQQHDQLMKQLKKYGIDMLDVTTSKPFINDLITFFRKRMRC